MHARDFGGMSIPVLALDRSMSAICLIENSPLPKTYNGIWNNLQGIVLVHDFRRATAEAAMDLFRGADLNSISPFVPRIGTCPRK